MDTNKDQWFPIALCICKTLKIGQMTDNDGSFKQKATPHRFFNNVKLERSQWYLSFFLHAIASLEISQWYSSMDNAVLWIIYPLNIYRNLRITIKTKSRQILLIQLCITWMLSHIHTFDLLRIVSKKKLGNLHFEINPSNAGLQRLAPNWKIKKQDFCRS